MLENQRDILQWKVSRYERAGALSVEISKATVDDIIFALYAKDSNP